MNSSKASNFTPTLVTRDGWFSGYGAIFGNVDSHGDQIERGAFAKSLREWEAKGKLPPMRLQHGSAGNVFRHDDLPVGKWLAMREDARGLYVEGKLLALDTDQGKRLLSLMQNVALDGLSIGYRERLSRRGTGAVKRHLLDLDLRELSLVDEPSNPLSRVAPISHAEAAADRLRDALAAAVAAEAKPKQADGDPLEKLKAALSRVA